MRKSEKSLLVTVVLIALAVIFSLCCGADGAEAGSAVTSVMIDDGTLTVEAEITSYYVGQDDELALFSVLSDDLSELWFPTAKAPASSHVTFSAKINTADLAVWQSGFVVAVKDGAKYRAITDIAFIDNVAGNSLSRRERKSPDGVKGLQVQLVTDALRLGVKSSTVTIITNELFGSDGETFSYGGREYTLDAGKLSRLDGMISSLCSAGIRVYAELLWRTAETGRISLPPDTEIDYAGAWPALTWFLADRYSSQSAFCDSFIIGYEVNDKKARLGDELTTDGEYLDVCADMIRQARTSVMSVSEGNAVFVSVSDLWSAEWNPDGEFGAEEFLRSVARRIPLDGFGVSVNIFPDDAHDDNGIYVTADNLDLMTSIGASYYIIGNSGVSGTPGTASEKDQAEKYLKMYDAVCANGKIESFIWHRHVDYADENGFYGLYSSQKDLIPQQTKEVYKAFLYADRSDPDAASYRAALLGADAVSYSGIRECFYVSQTPVENTAPVLDFSSDLYGFLPSFNSSELGICDEKGVRFLRVVASRAEGVEWFGCKGSVPFSAVKGAECLSFRMKVEGSGDKEICVILKNGDKYLEYSSGVFDGWYDYAFSVRNFCDPLSEGSFEVIILAKNGTGNTGLSLDVEKISVSAKSYTYLLVSAIAVTSAAALTVITATVVYFAKKRRGDR